MKKRAQTLSPTPSRQFCFQVFTFTLLGIAVTAPLSSVHAQTVSEDASVKTAWKKSVERHFAHSQPISLSSTPSNASDISSFSDNSASINHWSQKGKASWYIGRRVHGTTKALTAAHRSLPFGTKLLVKSPGTGRSVVVTVNDRGPYIKGRIIDLSKTAANQLGIVNKGTTNVVISKVTPAQARDIEVAEAPEDATNDEAIAAAAQTPVHHMQHGRQHKRHARR